MDFISDGVARGHISSTLSCRARSHAAKFQNSANTRPKLDSPFGYSFNASILPGDSCPVQWQLAAQGLLFWHLSSRRQEAQQKFKKKIDFDFLLL
jgi:hypothetical protein